MSCIRSSARSSCAITTRPAPSAKRYRREDEIGTPFCITFDFNTVGTETDEADHCVTVRERDSMTQVRIPITEVKDYISERIKF